MPERYSGITGHGGTDAEIILPPAFLASLHNAMPALASARRPRRERYQFFITVRPITRPMSGLEKS